jgi:hypothetical protein
MKSNHFPFVIFHFSFVICKHFGLLMLKIAPDDKWKMENDKWNAIPTTLNSVV